MTGFRSLLCGLAVLMTAAGAATAQEPGPPKVDPGGKTLRAASALYTAGQYEMAANTYASFLKEYGKDSRATDAKYGLAGCRYHLRQYDKAAEAMAVVAAVKGFKHHNDAMLVLGYCQLVLKDYPKAAATLQKLMTEAPKSPQALRAGVNLVQALFFGDKLAECSKACEAYVKAYPEAPSRFVARYFQGQSLRKLGKNAEAVAALAELVDQPGNPRRVGAMVLSAQCLRDLAKYDQAEAMYRKMLKIAPAPKQAGGHYGLALVLYDAGKYPEAITECKAVLAVKKCPYIPAARMQLALAQWEAGKTADARATFNAVVKADATRAIRAQYWLARCDMADGKHAEARTALLALAKKKVDSLRLKRIAFDVGMCSLSAGEFAQGVADFQAYRKAYPKGPGAVETMYREAFCLHQLKKYAESQALCEKVARAAPGPVTAGAAALSAENLLLSGKYEAAEKAFAALAAAAVAAKDAAKTLRFSVRRGQCAHLAEQHERAVELLTPLAGDKKLTAIEPLREAILQLGESQLALKQYPAAVKTIGRYLTVGKEHAARARCRLGSAYLQGGKKDEAAKAFLAGMKGPADSLWVIRSTFEYGHLAYEQGQAAKAAPALAKVLASKVATPDLAGGAAYLLAWIDYGDEKYPEAATRFAAMVKTYPQHPRAPDAAYQQAVATKLAGQHAAALGLFEGYLKSYPAGDSAAEAKYEVGKCQTALGKHAEAKAVFAALAGGEKTVSDGVLYDLAWAQRETKEPKAAIATYRRLIKEYPDSTMLAAARTELGNMLYLEKEYAAAAALLEAVIVDKAAEAHRLEAARYQVGCCYEKMGNDVKTASAMAAFAAAYPKHEHTASALYLAGVAQANLKKYDEAAKHFAAVVKGFPKHDLLANAYIKLGQVQNNGGQFKQAEAAFAAYLAKFPEGQWAYLARFGTGWSLEGRKKYPDARKWYALVEKTHDGQTAARAKYQIGQTHFAERNYKQAAAELISVYAVYDYPNWSSKAMLEAGNVFLAAKDAGAAKAQYALCIKKYPKSKEALLAAEELKKLGG